MQRFRQWIVGLLSIMLLAGCGVELVAPTSVAPTPSSEGQVAAASVVPTIENTPTLVPSPTIPPTTSPLPTFTPATSGTSTTVASVPTDQPAATPATQPTTAPPVSQPTIAPPSDPTEAAIVLIRERYTTINNAVSGYRRTEQDLQGFSTEGGTLEAFYDGNVLRKLVVTYLGETGKASEEYYFWDDQLFFVFRADSFYDKPFGTVVQTTENRYYFANDRMIRWIDEAKQQVPPGESSFIERQAQVTQQAIDVRTLLPQ